ATMEREDPPGPLSALTCPECGGPLFDLKHEELDRYRCRSGHAYTAGSIAAGQGEGVEEALWVAVNTLNENALLSERMARDARYRGHEWLAARFEKKGREMERRAAMLRGLVRTSGEPVFETEAEEREKENEQESERSTW